MEKQHQPTLADAACELRTKKIKNSFLSEINSLIDWQAIKEIIDKDYKKGKSAVGKPSYSGLLLFKMLLLQYWYGLSDYEVEERVNDSISFSYFCGLSIDEAAPDHSTISRFRSALTEKGTFDKLFSEINRQLESHQIIVKKGVIVDASIVDTPHKPKGKSMYNVVEREETIIEKVYPSSVDKEGSW
jgi:IS5 family transposase